MEVTVEVVVVASTPKWWHPVLVTAVTRSGGGLWRVNTGKDVVILLQDPNFQPWGLGATFRVAATHGVWVRRACGRGVSWGDKGVRLSCLQGTPLVGFELEMDNEFLKNNLQVQLHLTYTDRAGRLV